MRTAAYLRWLATGQVLAIGAMMFAMLRLLC